MNSKKVVIILVSLMFVVVYAIDPVYLSNKRGKIVEPGQVHTAHYEWIVADTTTSAGTEPTDLAVGERTYATVAAAVAADDSGDGEISICGDSAAEKANMESWNLVRFRCRGITDGASIVYQIYLGTLVVGGTDCELAYAGQLGFTVGTQASVDTGYEMADTLAVTESDWVKSVASSSSADNRVAEAALDLMGANMIVVVASTAGCDCKLIIKGY